MKQSNVDEIEKDWSWEDEQLDYEGEENSSQSSSSSDQESSVQDQQPAPIKKTRKSTIRTSSKITPEILLSKPNGFKYVRKNFEKMKNSLHLSPTSLMSDAQKIILFYNEWFHYLQPKFKTIHVARDVERICHSGLLNGYFRTIKELQSKGELDGFDEELKYGTTGNETNNELDSQSNTNEEIKQQIEQNKFEAQQRLLSRLQQQQQ